MGRCSKLCNEIKNSINSISGLDDDFVYNWLVVLKGITDNIVDRISKYSEENKINGTCFKTLMIRHKISSPIIKRIIKALLKVLLCIFIYTIIMFLIYVFPVTMTFIFLMAGIVLLFRLFYNYDK